MATLPSRTPSGYDVSLLGRKQVADGTMAFFFERPAGFSFKAGQSIDLALLDPPETDAEGNVRAFSIASAPHDAGYLIIATRMRDSAFKRVLRDAPLGTEVNIQGPFGSFTLHNNVSKPAVFLAGGIGITPALSILRQAAHEQRPHQLYLFYSNRRMEDAAFLDELQRLEKENANFHFVPTFTGLPCPNVKWNGAVGFITEEMLKTQLPQLHGPIYYVVGPPTMVSAMQDLLQKAGVDSDDVRTEEFSGY